MKLELLEGFLLQREKRFLANVRFANGDIIVAHCPNPGSMRGNAETGMRVWLEDLGNGQRKLRYKWVLVEAKGQRVCIDTSVANRLVAEALATGRIPELHGYTSIRPEAKEGDSRYDFLLEAPQSPDCYVEVKSVSMGEGNAGRFPDSVTKRGQKHLLGLQRLKAQGKRAVLLFLLMREGGKSVSPAREIDPDYARLLDDSVEKGVEVLVYGIEIRKDGLVLGKKGSFFPHE